MKSETIAILKNVINSMNREIVINSVVGNVLNVSRTLNVTIYKVLTDSNGLQWKVVDFEANQSITVEPFGHSDPFTATSIFSPLPLFLHGTPMSANNEYLVIDNKTREKTPFVWFLSPYTENKEGVMSSIDYTAQVRLFLMEEANNPKWLNDDHDKYAVNPMFELAEMIIQKLNSLYNVNRIDDWVIRDRARFGIEIANRGNTNRIIDEDVSGVEMNVSFAVQKSKKC